MPKGKKHAASRSKSTGPTTTQGTPELPQSAPTGDAANSGVTLNSAQYQTSGHDRTISSTAVSDDHDEISRVLSAIQQGLDAYEMPLGHYYFIIDDVDHALAVIAYIALRTKKTICGLSVKQNIGYIRQLLARITGLNVNGYICSWSKKKGHPDPSQKMYLRPYKQCYPFLKAPGDSCFICWGPPENCQKWMVKCAQERRTCMILTRDQYMAVKRHITVFRIAPHPLSERLNDVLQDIPPSSAMDPLPLVVGTQEERSVIFNPSITCLLPEGHYFIALNDPLDTIPLICYLALQSTRTFCFLDAKSPWGAFTILLNRITGLKTMYSSQKSLVLVQETMQDFKLTPRSIMLRPSDEWNAGFGKSLADCVIFCGVPENTFESQASCSRKAEHSYIVVSPSPSTTPLEQVFPGRSQHPSSNQFNNDKEESVLHELRLRTRTILENPDDPPISVDQYKAWLTRSLHHIDEPSSSGELGNSLQGTVLPRPAPKATKKKKKTHSRTFWDSESLESLDFELQFDALFIDPWAPQPPTVPLARPLLEGHYCIPLDNPFDAVPLISYLALRSTRTLCFLSADESWEAYQVLFNRITGLKTSICEETDMQRIVSAMRFFQLQASGMILRPANDAWNSGFGELVADCVIYWGLPNRLDEFKENCILKSRHSYVIMSHSQFTDPSMQMFPGDSFWPHPSTSLFNNQSQDSVLHELRLKMGHILATMTYPPISADEWEEFPSEKQDSSLQDPELPSSHLAVEKYLANDNTSILVYMIPEYPLPKGHYCIPIDEALDAVPLISYLALRSKRTLCFTRAGDLWDAYQWLFTQITGIFTTHCTETQGEKVMAAMRLFDSHSSAILLCPANQAWASGFSESLADCVIYWGYPDELEEFADSCLLKATYSYLIIPYSHLADVEVRRLSRYDFPCHLSTSLFNDETQHSVLNGLRSRTGAVLAAMSNPPILVDEYRDLLRSRNGFGQMPVRIQTDRSSLRDKSFRKLSHSDGRFDWILK